LNTFNEQLLLNITTTVEGSASRSSEVALKGNGNFMDEVDLRTHYKDWVVTRWVVAE